MSLLLGVDAGGTHCRCLLADLAGRILARADGGPANYQDVGATHAQKSLADVCAQALAKANVRAEDVRHAAFGVAGADRPKDFEAIEALLPRLPGCGSRTLVNDSELALHAGTADGVGIAVVSGTGSNTLGRDEAGRMMRVGGLCFELGDSGSGNDLGRDALRAAMRGKDGRGPPTSLYASICAQLQVDPLEDMIDYWMSGDARGQDLGRLAPLVFAAASKGDAVAKELLTAAGQELALSVRVLAAKLFPERTMPMPVVLGGSVLQHGSDPTMVRAMVEALATVPCGVDVLRLELEPVYGAVILACSSEYPSPTRSEFRTKLLGALGTQAVSPVA